MLVLMNLLEELRPQGRAASALASLVGLCTDHKQTRYPCARNDPREREHPQVHKHNYGEVYVLHFALVANVTQWRSKVHVPRENSTVHYRQRGLIVGRMQLQ